MGAYLCIATVINTQFQCSAPFPPTAPRAASHFSFSPSFHLKYLLIFISFASSYPPFAHRFQARRGNNFSWGTATTLMLLKINFLYYFDIVSQNGVPPSVSKRIILDVECKFLSFLICSSINLQCWKVFRWKFHELFCSSLAIFAGRRTQHRNLYSTPTNSFSDDLG